MKTDAEVVHRLLTDLEYELSTLYSGKLAALNKVVAKQTEIVNQQREEIARLNTVIDKMQNVVHRRIAFVDAGSVK